MNLWCILGEGPKRPKEEHHEAQIGYLGLDLGSFSSRTLTGGELPRGSLTKLVYNPKHPLQGLVWPFYKLPSLQTPRLS